MSNKAYQGFRLWSSTVCSNGFLESWGFNALANLSYGSDLFEQQFPAPLFRDACCRNSERWRINKTHEWGFIWYDFSSKYSLHTNKFNCHKTSGTQLSGQLDSHKNLPLFTISNVILNLHGYLFFYVDWGCQTKKPPEVMFLCDFRHFCDEQTRAQLEALWLMPRHQNLVSNQI